MIAITLVVNAAPDKGVWRIGRDADPLALSGPLQPEEVLDCRAGNRFDSPTGDYGVGYFGSTPEACFAETLARFRPDTSLESLFDHDDSMGFGELPRDWRQARRLVHVKFAPSPTRPLLQFVDVEQSQTIRHLERALAPMLAYYGYPHLNVSVLRGGDRRVTRLVSKYIHSQRGPDDAPLYAGIQYRSQLGSDWQCWAMFEGVGIERVSTRGIELQDPTFRKICSRYGLTPF